MIDVEKPLSRCNCLTAAARAARAWRTAFMMMLCSLLLACGALLDDEARIERARQAMANQQYSAAIIDLKNVLQRSPENALANELLGLAMAESDDYESVVKYLENALELGRPLDRFRVVLVEARLETGQPEAALEIADPASATDRESEFNLWLYRGDAQFELGELVAALQSYRQAESLSVDSGRALLRRTGLFWAEGNLPDARAAAESAIELDADNLPAYDMLAGILMEMEAWPQARDVLMGALSVVQEDTWLKGFLYASLTEVHLELGEQADARNALANVARLWPESDPDFQILRARVALADREFRDAATALRSYREYYPDSEPALRMLGAAQFGQGLYQQARVQLQRALSIDPDQADTRRVLAQTLLVLGDPVRAREVLEPALYLTPDDPLLLSLLGALDATGESALDELAEPYRSVLDALVKGQFVASLESAESSARDRVDDPGVLNLLGLAQLANRQSAEAVTTLKRALAAAPGSYEPRVNLARALLADGNPQQGLGILDDTDNDERVAGFGATRQALLVAYLERDATGEEASLEIPLDWLDQTPDSWSTRIVFAQTLMQRSQFAEAAAQFELLVEDGVSDPAIYNNLAWSYHQIGDSRALEFARRAYDLAPYDGEIVDTLGWILASEGAPDDGLALLREAYTLRPGDREIAYHLAYMLSRSDAADEAIALLEALPRRETSGQRDAAEALLSELNAAI